MEIRRLFPLLFLPLFLLWGCSSSLSEAGPSPVEPSAGVISDAQSWELLLVNAEHPVPDGYSFIESALPNGRVVDERIYDALGEMLSACRAAGLSPVVCSAYRSEERQAELFAEKVSELQRAGLSEEEAERQAEQTLSPPGCSEHQTGLAVDIVSERYQLLDAHQAETAEQQWLMAHCAEYGFVLRYPEGSEAVTGVAYEPWHYRYVGRAAAAEMTARGLTLEEYLLS